MRVEVSGNKFNFPPQCACCGGTAYATLLASASRSTGTRVVRTNSKSWDFPYCNQCLSHVQAIASAHQLGVTMLLLGGVGAIVLMFKIESWPGYLLGATVMIAVVWAYNRLVANAKKLCTPSCTAVRSAVGYLGWEGSRHIFDIGSSGYAYSFMVANLNKLVNVTPDVWEWLRKSGHVPPPYQPQSPKRNMR